MKIALKNFVNIFLLFYCLLKPLFGVADDFKTQVYGRPLFKSLTVGAHAALNIHLSDFRELPLAHIPVAVCTRAAYTAEEDDCEIKFCFKELTDSDGNLTLPDLNELFLNRPGVITKSSYPDRDRVGSPCPGTYLSAQDESDVELHYRSYELTEVRELESNSPLYEAGRFVPYRLEGYLSLSEQPRVKRAGTMFFAAHTDFNKTLETLRKVENITKWPSLLNCLNDYPGNRLVRYFNFACSNFIKELEAYRTSLVGLEKPDENEFLVSEFRLELESFLGKIFLSGVPDESLLFSVKELNAVFAVLYSYYYDEILDGYFISRGGDLPNPFHDYQDDVKTWLNTHFAELDTVMKKFERMLHEMKVTGRLVKEGTSYEVKSHEITGCRDAEQFGYGKASEFCKARHLGRAVSVEAGACIETEPGSGDATVPISFMCI